MRRRLKAMTGEETGDDRIMYDRTDPLVDVPAPQEELGFEGAAGGGPEAGGAMPMLAGLGGGGEMPTTDALSDTDLAAMTEPVDIPEEEDEQVASLEALLADPNISPQERQQIEMQMADSARRRLAGLGGLGL